MQLPPPPTSHVSFFNEVKTIKLCLTLKTLCCICLLPPKASNASQPHHKRRLDTFILKVCLCLRVCSHTHTHTHV